jgi:Tfp pilus assembly protein PilF
MMKNWDAELGEGATSDDKADAHYHLAAAARKQGDTRKAKILLSKALLENPEHEYAQRLLAELEAG